MTTALLVAIRDGRVLLHAVERDANGFPRLYFPSNRTGRYCDRDPYTYDCMWQPLSCALWAGSRSCRAV